MADKAISYKANKFSSISQHTVTVIPFTDVHRVLRMRNEEDILITFAAFFENSVSFDIEWCVYM